MSGPLAGMCSAPTICGRKTARNVGARVNSMVRYSTFATYRPCITAWVPATLEPATSTARAGMAGNGTPARRLVGEIRHTGVVKIQPGTATSALSAVDRPADRTRDLVARTILETGPQNAADLAGRLGLSPAGIRRHLDALVADGLLLEREPRPAAHRGRGRPARSYALTDAGRAAFPHAYDDLASTALRYLRATGGEDAVTAFAEHRAKTLAEHLAPDVDRNAPLATRAEHMARSLTAHGYAATTAQAGSGIQVCQ